MIKSTIKLSIVLILVVTSSCINSNDNKVAIIENNFDNIYGWFEGQTVSDKFQHSGKYSYHLDNMKEYGMGFNAPVSQTIPKGSSSITIEAWVLTKEINTDVSIVFEIINSDNKSVIWNECNSKATVKQANKWTLISTTFTIAADIPREFIVKSYCWNKNKGDYYIDDIKIFAGN
ncbi:MAG: carbohydrate binding domain-containing protein [Bacteroidia bacterium]